MKYFISKKAVTDINNIWIYTYEVWGAEQANKYYNQIKKEIEFIAENFDCGKSIEHLKKGYRVSKIKSHLIFYKKSDADTVEIVRILHQNMDIDNRLTD